MPRRRSYTWPIVAAIVALLIVIIALPQRWRAWAPTFLQQPGLHLGLDLAGGTQLDFRISETEIQDQMNTIQQQIDQAHKTNAAADTLNALRAQLKSVQDQRSNLVEAIRTVLERRINALGVSESTITPSYVGNEKHLLVECPGVVDVQKCIAVVGKTIQLEFKEQQTEATDQFKNDVRAQVAAAVKRIAQSGSSLQKEGQDIGPQVGGYSDAHAFFQDQLPKGLEDLWTMQPGKMMQRDGSITQTGSDSKGRATQTDVPGVFLAQVVKPQTGTGRVIAEANKAFALLAKTESGATYAYKANVAVDDKLDSQIASTLRNMQPGALKTVSVGASARIVFLRSFRPSSEQIQASHILISYKGATGADATITRTKAQALAKAKDLKAQLDKGADLNALASKESDGPSRKDGGRLGSLSRGTMAPAFDAVAFAMKQRQISEPVDTPFGYDIIRLDKGASTTPAQADYDELKITGKTPLRSADALVAKMQNGQIKSQESAVTLRTLFFSLVPSGWKSTALDGKHFRSAAVSLDPVTNVPVVQIAFDTEGAKIFQELTKKNIGKQIAIFVGGQMVSAPRVQSEISGGNAVITGSPNIADAQQLAQDLNTGAIPAPIHLTGQYTVEATLGSAALQTSLMAALIGIIILMLYMIVVYRGLGVIADVSLVMYALLLFAILKLPLLFFTSDYIVLTLAGMAGIILSIGMAVDANVLVFERMKEEFRKGKIVKSSVESSFKHAWPAIRDGNVSTLITCAILFLIGTSIVRGFAVTLGMGVILSMFTSFWITRLMLRRLADSPYAKWLDPYNGKGPDTLSKSEPVAAPAA